MSIVNYVDLFVGALINAFLCTFVVKKVFSLNYCENKIKVIFYISFFTICLSTINVFDKDKFKLLITFPFVVISIKNIFSITYKKSIIYVIFSSLYMFIGEIIAGIFLSILPFDSSFIFNNFLGKTIGNLLVLIFTMPISYIKPLKKYVNNILYEIMDKFNYLLVVIIIVAIGSISYKNLFNYSSLINIFMNLITTITFILIIYMYLKEIVKSNELSEKYNMLFDYLDRYEKELVEKRKIIHDYKNQLIVINGYIGDDKKLSEYIQELIQEQRNVPENSIIKNIDKLPKGLKGLIYYKLSHISQEIKINIEITSSLKRFEKMNSKLNKNVLKIVGVLIDNAIDATEIEFEKYINIEFSIIKGIFKMKMENSCSQNIKINDIMSSGFSTKGNNRGYGLPLVKDIINKQKAIDLNLTIDNNTFISNLSVNIK